MKQEIVFDNLKWKEIVMWSDRWDRDHGCCGVTWDCVEMLCSVVCRRSGREQLPDVSYSTAYYSFTWWMFSDGDSSGHAVVMWVMPASVQWPVSCQWYHHQYGPVWVEQWSSNWNKNNNNWASQQSLCLTVNMNTGMHQQQLNLSLFKHTQKLLIF